MPEQPNVLTELGPCLTFHPDDTFQISAFVFSPRGLEKVEFEPPLEETEWVIERLVRVGECLSIWIGDLLNWSEQTYGDRWTQIIPDLMRRTGLERQTLYNAKSVMARVPIHNRSPSRTFRDYAAVAHLPEKEQAANLAEKDERGESSNEFYARLHPRREDGYTVQISCPDCGTVFEASVSRPVEVIMTRSLIKGEG